MKIKNDSNPIKIETFRNLLNFYYPKELCDNAIFFFGLTNKSCEYDFQVAQIS